MLKTTFPRDYQMTFNDHWIYSQKIIPMAYTKLLKEMIASGIRSQLIA